MHARTHTHTHEHIRAHGHMHTHLQQNSFHLFIYIYTPLCIEQTLHMDIIRWSTLKSDWLYSLQPKMEKLYTVSKHKTRSWLWLRYELLIAKFRLKLKKVRKITRPFRYDLNQIPYDYTVEVRTRFKGLDLIDRVPDELWMEVCDIVQETGNKPIPMENKCKKSKIAVWGGLTNSCEKKRSEKQRRKGKI